MAGMAHDEVSGTWRTEIARELAGVVERRIERREASEAVVDSEPGSACAAGEAAGEDGEAERFRQRRAAGEDAICPVGAVAQPRPPAASRERCEHERGDRRQHVDVLVAVHMVRRHAEDVDEALHLSLDFVGDFFRCVRREIPSRAHPGADVGQPTRRCHHWHRAKRGPHRKIEMQPDVGTSGMMPQRAGELGPPGRRRHHARRRKAPGVERLEDPPADTRRHRVIVGAERDAELAALGGHAPFSLLQSMERKQARTH